MLSPPYTRTNFGSAENDAVYVKAASAIDF